MSTSSSLRPTTVGSIVRDRPLSERLKRAILFASLLAVVLGLSALAQLATSPSWLAWVLLAVAGWLLAMLLWNLIRTRSDLTMDLSKLRESEQLARVADRAKTEFLANMSHEIRTPMHAVLGMAEVLLEMDLPARAQQPLEVIQASGEALLSLIDDVLDFSKLEAGTLILVENPFDLHQLLEKVVSLLSARADEKGLAFAYERGSGIPRHVRGDGARLRQVLLNLGGNAVKFTREGKVRFRVESLATAERDADSGEIRFSVQDSGIGISVDDQRRIFDTFIQADSTSARKFGGSGLGLAISKQLVERMGGELGVESERGVGSTFSFRLPLPASEPPAEPADTGDPEARARQRAGFRVLAVDDQPANRMVAISLLESLGYQVETAASGREALSRLAAARQGGESFAAVLMDCQMPELDGYDTTRGLRADEAENGGAGRQGAGIPVIAVTAHVLAGERQRCLDAGMDDYLAKPVRKADLAARLDRLLLGHAPPAVDPTPVIEPPTHPQGTPADGIAEPEVITVLRARGSRLGRDVLGEMVTKYVRDGQEILEEMGRAAVDGDAERAASAAHRLRGTSAILGGEQLANLCHELELRLQGGGFGATGDGDGDPQIEAVAAAFEDFVSWLRSL